MLKRCYCKDNLITNPTYKDCTVCDEWHLFSNFKSWMETQDWENKELDKDLLVYKNKAYSPETCCFVPREINLFLVLSDKIRGSYPVGVSLHSDNRCNSEALVAYIKDGKSSKYLGRFKDQTLAHKAWQEAKIERGEVLKLKQTNTLIIKGLTRVINKLKYDLENNLETTDL